MTMNRCLMVSELCFAAEGLSGSAAASSLRKLGSIMELAPSGRLFGAIATLADISAKAAVSLEDGSKALTDTREEEATVKLSIALAEMDVLATQAVRTTGKPRRRTAR